MSWFFLDHLFSNGVALSRTLALWGVLSSSSLPLKILRLNLLALWSAKVKLKLLIINTDRQSPPPLRARTASEHASVLNFNPVFFPGSLCVQYRLAFEKMLALFYLPLLSICIRKSTWVLRNSRRYHSHKTEQTWMTSSAIQAMPSLYDQIF